MEEFNEGKRDYLLTWNEMDSFPEDGHSVLLVDGAGLINFARYEPRKTRTPLVIISTLGSTRLGTMLSGIAWAEFPIG